MSSKRAGAGDAGPSRASGSKPPPPRSGAASPTPPAGPAAAAPTASPTRRFDWIESAVGPSSMPAVLRPGSRADSRGSRPRSPAPDFWARQSAPQIVDTSVKDPALKLSLMTRALEESRARIAHLQQDRAAVADAVQQLCLAAAAACSSAGGEDEGGMPFGAAGDPAAAAGTAAEAASDGAPEGDALPLRLNELSTRLAQLHEALSLQAAAVAEARGAHERAALQVVAQQQRREVLEAQLEEARYAVQQHDAARHAAEVKARLLEEQACAAAESARRRMEEQLDTFRGDAATARRVRTLRGRFAELEQQLAAAQRAQRADADERQRLEGQVLRLQGRLASAEDQAAQLRQQLWDKTAAHTELASQHRALQEERRGLAVHSQQLAAALAEWQQRAQQLETLGAGLQAESAAGRQLHAALQQEGEDLRAELQQERVRAHGLQAALAEERLACASQRAALQGRGEEVASLAASLDDYCKRIVAAEGALEEARREAQAEAEARREAEGASKAAQHEAACLRGSLDEVAEAEAELRQQLGAAEARAAQAAGAAEAARQRVQQLERQAAAAREAAQAQAASLADQAARLREAASLAQQAESQKQQLAALAEELRGAAARQAAVQATADEVAAAKQQAERSLHKQTVLAQRLQEQSASLGAQLQAATKELAAAQARADDLAGQLAQQQEQHEAATAAQQAAHEERRARNEHLEHEKRQQAILIAELEARAVSLGARMEATQQHNAALHRYAVAHGAAYGRMAAHAAGLHQQFERQLAGLLSACRHLGLQLSAALSAADPLAPLQPANSSRGRSSSSARGSQAAEGPAAVPAALLASPEVAAAAVAAAALSIEGLRTELAVAVQLLEMQGSSAEAQQLAAVPAGIAEALAADLAGLPPSLLASPRLAPAEGGTPAPLAPPAAAHHHHQQRPQQPEQQQSVLSAQVAQMEANLERLAAAGAERAARAAAATQLHQQEQAARQRAQDMVTQLASQLAATQADLAATRQQRDELEATGRRLSRELRDAIYTLSQLHASQQGQAASWRLRGLQSADTQTQYCELWQANLCGPAGGGGTPAPAAVCEADASGEGSVLCAASESSAGSGSEDGGGGGADSPAVAEAAEAVPAAPAPAVRVLALPALQQLIRELYRAKAAADIAVARGQRPFQPLADFVAAHLAQQSGAEGAVVQARAQQLQASVEAHAAADREVALFGLAAGMLEEAEDSEHRWQCGPGEAAPPLVVAPAASPCSPAVPHPASAAAAAVPLVLYHSRRAAGTAASRRLADALPALRRFAASAWHAAAAASAARAPLAGPGRPFSPAGPDQLLPPMAAEVHNLALGVPGVEQLAAWVLGGGLGAVLPRLDLGLCLAESQLPQLYLLAVEAARLLGLQGATPQLYIKGSSEAAAYYLLLPASARLHGFNGGPAEQQEGGQPAGGAGGCGAGGGGGSPAASGGASSEHGSLLMAPTAASAAKAAAPSARSARSAGGSDSDTYGLELEPTRSLLDPSAGGHSAVAAVEGQEWQCALVLTSGLVDLLEPAELQAVMAGCLGFHAALTCPSGAGLGPGGGPEAARLAVLCRSMAALASLAALCALGPDALAARLPATMAPFFFSRVQPVLRRAGRYLQLYCDRVAAAAAGAWRPVAAAAVKQAAGCAVLRNELNLDAVIAQAAALDEAGADLAPAALLREDGATLAAAGASLPLLRVRELQRWWAARNGQ